MARADGTLPLALWRCVAVGALAGLLFGLLVEWVQTSESKSLTVMAAVCGSTSSLVRPQFEPIIDLDAANERCTTSSVRPEYQSLTFGKIRGITREGVRDVWIVGNDESIRAGFGALRHSRSEPGAPHTSRIPIQAFAIIAELIKGEGRRQLRLPCSL